MLRPNFNKKTLALTLLKKFLIQPQSVIVCMSSKYSSSASVFYSMCVLWMKKGMSEWTNDWMDECNTNVQDFTDVWQALLPVLDRVKKRSNEPRRWHALDLHCVVIKRLHDVVKGTEDVSTLRRAFHVLLDTEFECRPRLVNFFYTLQQTQSSSYGFHKSTHKTTTLALTLKLRSTNWKHSNKESWSSQFQGNSVL